MIVKDKNICSGVPTIKGKNITVVTIIENVKNNIPWGELCDKYEITTQDIKDCIDYTIQFIKTEINKQKVE